MQYAQPFFEGLTGPASLTFLGLLLIAFLIGALPPSFAYAARVGKLRRRIARRDEALAAARTELGELERVRAEGERTLQLREAEATELKERLRRVSVERQASASEGTRLREELEDLRGSQLGAQIEAQANAEEVQVLRGRIDALQAQVQSLRQAARAQQSPSAGAFDVNTLASLRAARTKAETLEARLAQVTADNEALRRQLS